MGRIRTLSLCWLLLSFGGGAFAQPALTCTSNAGVPPIVRAEGLAELVGDVVLNCAGGDPNLTFNVNWQIFLNTNITSRIVSSSAAPTTPPGTTPTEALMLIQDPSTLVTSGPGQNVFRGIRAADNSITWLGVPFTPPAPGSTRIIRFTNIRANANQLGLSGGQIPTQIVMYVSASGTYSVPINNPQQTVGFILSGMSFAVRNCRDTGDRASDFSQCISQNEAQYSDPTAGGTAQAGLRFIENFATAFKTKKATNQDPSGPGWVYNSESGFMNTAVLGGETGAATQGTRLLARFANVPPGVRIFVGTNAGEGSTNSIGAVLVTTTDPTGAAGDASSPVAAVNARSVCGSNSTIPVAEVPLSGGSGTATWEITAASPFTIEQVVFPVLIAYRADPANNLPGLGAGTVAGGFAPLSTVTTMSASAPAPRFADSLVVRAAFTINSCSAPPGPRFVSLTGPGASGTGGMFTLQYSDPNGHNAFWRVQVAVNDYLRGFRSCLVYYTANADVMYLLNDLGTTWLGPIRFGVPGTLANSQCTLDMGLSSRLRSGNDLILNLYFTFKAGFAGPKSVFTEAMNNLAASSNWQTVGSYTVAGGANSPPSIDFLTPDSGAGSNAVFRFVLSDPDGAGDLDRLQVIFSNGFNPTNACYVYYAALSGLTYLAGDNPATWIGPVMLGQSVTLQNSQCMLRVGTSWVSYFGNSMEVNLDLAFKSAFAGPKTIYAETRDRLETQANNWRTMGTWTAVGLVNLTPAADWVNPSAGSGTTQTLTFQFSDGNGYADIVRAQVLFNTTQSGAAACLLYYVRGSNLVYLLNDSGTGWLGPSLLGTPGALQNTQCALNTGTAAATPAGNTLQLALPMTFRTPAFSGAKNIYAEAQDVAGATSGWRTIGTWGVP